MIPERIETERLILRPITKKDVHRIHTAWNNPQSYLYNSIDWNEEDVAELCDRPTGGISGMYFMVAELKKFIISSTKKKGNLEKPKK